MSFEVSDDMRHYIDERVASGRYGSPSEYLCELVRQDQVEQAKNKLRALIEEGINSGPGREMTEADDEELLAIARGEID